MAETGGDWDVWRWGLGVLGSILGGTALAGWIARGKIDEIVREHELLKQQQVRCQATLKADIESIVQRATDAQSLRYAEQLAAIRTELAVITALHGETQADVKSIFDRLERRKTEVVLPPHGERRDQV
jgi:hypothetical protein